MQKSTLIIVVIIVNAILFAALVAGAIALTAQSNDSEPPVTSFKECVDRGYPVQESYPERCSTPDGRSFTRPLTNGVTF